MLGRVGRVETHTIDKFFISQNDVPNPLRPRGARGTAWAESEGARSSTQGGLGPPGRAAGERHTVPRSAAACRERPIDCVGARPWARADLYTPGTPWSMLGSNGARGGGACESGGRERAAGGRAARARAARSPAPSPARAPVSATRSRASVKSGIWNKDEFEAFGGYCSGRWSSGIESDWRSGGPGFDSRSRRSGLLLLLRSSSSGSLQPHASRLTPHADPATQHAAFCAPGSGFLREGISLGSSTVFASAIVAPHRTHPVSSLDLAWRLVSELQGDARVGAGRADARGGPARLGKPIAASAARGQARSASPGSVQSGRRRRHGSAKSKKKKVCAVRVPKLAAEHPVNVLVH